jgi:hypothetical protein
MIGRGFMEKGQLEIIALVLSAKHSGGFKKTVIFFLGKRAIQKSG